MNSWHLSLTILAFCTVPALAAEKFVQLRTVANISSPNSKVHGNVSLIQYHGEKNFLISLEIFGLSSGLYGIYVYEKGLMGNDCKFNPDYEISNSNKFLFVGNLFTVEPEHNEMTRVNFSYQDIGLPEGHSIIGCSVDVYTCCVYDTVACGIINDITNSSVTSSTSTTSTPSTITNDEMQSTLSYPVTSSTSTVEAENIDETVIEEVEFLNISTSDENRYSVYINDQLTNDEIQSALSYLVTNSTSTVEAENTDDTVIEEVEFENISTSDENRYVYIHDQINF